MYVLCWKFSMWWLTPTPPLSHGNEKALLFTFCRMWWSLFFSPPLSLQILHKYQVAIINTAWMISSNFKNAVSIRRCKQVLAIWMEKPVTNYKAIPSCFEARCVYKAPVTRKAKSLCYCTHLWGTTIICCIKSGGWGERWQTNHKLHIMLLRLFYLVEVSL